MVTLPALRSLLRFLHVSGLILAPLADAVPAGPGYPRPVPPRAAFDERIRAVLALCDRESAGGRRDYAILLVMARLALRGGEVAGLELSDIDRRAAEVTVRGKGNRADDLPLPADVGEAVADYLLNGRPATRSRSLFVTLVAPFAGLAVPSVTELTSRACARAGSPGSVRTGCATPPRANCSPAAPRWRRSASCCGTRTSGPRRSTPTLGNCISRAGNCRSAAHRIAGTAFRSP